MVILELKKKGQQMDRGINVDQGVSQQTHGRKKEITGLMECRSMLIYSQSSISDCLF
jgi:hypothetical protein